MKPIIVGTDFSQGSYVALDLAVDIANKMHTDIKLIWVRKEKKLSSSEALDETSRLAVDKLKALCEQRQERLTQGTIDWEIMTGKVDSAIAEIARRTNASMIVIGTNGASGYEKYIMGSTAVRIVQEAPCPTLTIREGFNFHKQLERIVVPLRVNANSRQKVPPAMRLAKLFGAKIHILGLIETAQDAFTLKTYMKQAEQLLAQENIDYTSVGRKYSNYTQTVMQYCEDVNADLVVINTEQDRLLARLFLGTNAQQMVHKSQIPVLCIHPEDIGDIAR